MLDKETDQDHVEEASATVNAAGVSFHFSNGTSESQDTEPLLTPGLTTISGDHDEKQKAVQTDPSVQRVLDLLKYIEQVEKLKSKPAFSVPTDHFAAFQHELKGLPELQVNLQSEDDEVWLRLPRLIEISAPEPDEILKPWLTLAKSPDKHPELKTEKVIMVGKVEVQRDQLGDHPQVKELFDWYLENQWLPWAAAESPRRKTIARYNQLFVLQQAISSEGAETPLELAWGVGYAVWKKAGFDTAVKHPLLVQSCEITLNAKNFNLEVRPRDVEARLEIDCYAQMEIPGVKPLEDYWKTSLATGAHRINPFDESTFEGVLKTAVGRLDPSGVYEKRLDDVTPSAPNDKLKITNTWVIFGRKRSGDIFLDDIHRLKKKVAEVKELPSVIRSFVESGDSTVRVREEQPFRGLSSNDSAAGAFELFFPMPYNDEQVSIIQKLETNDGVVVQGPPGTGKTHTIANVICHYLAMGKRVLVTSKGESALAVLQEKLPERIRPLSVALLSDERDGMKQFEHSIQIIAGRVSEINPVRAQALIDEAEEKLNLLHAKISHIDTTVARYATSHMRNYSFQGKEVSPEEMAKIVLVEASEHQWFDDEPPETADGIVPINPVDISLLRKARIRVGSDLPYLPRILPSPGDFPEWIDLIGLHRDLVKARGIEANLTQGHALPLKDSLAGTFDKARALAPFLADRLALRLKVAKNPSPWKNTLQARLSDMDFDDTLLTALLDACEQIQELEAARRGMVAKSIDLPVDSEINADFCEAIERLLAGKSAFSLPFGRGEARKLIAATKVLGAPAASAAHWVLVKDLMLWRMEARKVLAQWQAMSGEFGLEPVSDPLDRGFRQVAEAQVYVEDVYAQIFDFEDRLYGHIEDTFGKRIADRLAQEGEPLIALIHASVHSHVEKDQLTYAVKRVQDLMAKMFGCSGPIVEELRSFLTESLSQATLDESALQATWMAHETELQRLTRLRPAFDDIQKIADLMQNAGADKWAARVRTEPAAKDHDTFTPEAWLEAWNWRQAVMFLDRIDGHQHLRKLFDERKTLTTSLARTYQDLVAEKTWLGVFKNSPDRVRQALQKYLTAVRSIGKGTGAKAGMYRRDARIAMTQAYSAVPCWVLPEWRIAETIPADLGLFDLVVIDEASQSDIWSLPALLRGKKLLVVGDHKQVSPSAVGLATQTIMELRSRFLNDQPHGPYMTPERSIYDLAQVVFAGNSVMLKEHFRCVPAIIEFSNREFYEGDIKPLRLPKANERLDPPLIDVFVKGGVRKGDENRAEAKAIVDEIEVILADEQFAGRTIGVVTLLGTAQAACIQKLVSTRISPADQMARKIAVGPPPVFQGRERDIMMVSMVLDHTDRAAQNRADQHQRFNVALSRARDRTYLFRSVDETNFGEDTLNSRLIRHFRQPFRQDIRRVQVMREKCESGFEFEMFDELVKRGYRVEPQVATGGYRIDFVVEGAEGRRLAIECDGDRFHGPGQWGDDMKRQRILERAGWTFWRCFASSFVRRRDAVVADLIETLDRLGIEPLGSESVDDTVWVYSKEVDPLGVEESAEDS